MGERRLTPAAPRAGADSDGATPTDATPTDATPTDATPTDATPTGATPTDATPTDATPTHATPTDATPTAVLSAVPAPPRPTDPASSAPASRLVVALVRGVHGLRGAVRVEVLTDRPDERFAVGRVLHREGSDEPLTIATAAPVEDGPGWRLRFAELPDRNGAESLRNAYLETDAATGSLARGEYYWHEVIGVPVSDVSGRNLGIVRDVYRAGGAEVFVVRDGPIGEFDVPAVRAFIRIFAPRRGEIVVDASALDLDLPPAPEPDA